MSTWMCIILFYFMFENSNNKKLKITCFCLDLSVQKITGEYILQMDLTVGDRADSHHILHRELASSSVFLEGS